MLGADQGAASRSRGEYDLTNLQDDELTVGGHDDEWATIYNEATNQTHEQVVLATLQRV